MVEKAEGRGRGAREWGVGSGERGRHLCRWWVGLDYLTMPGITVIICCADCEETLGPACESVGWADELIVVDSGSTDQTGEIAQKYADRYVLEPWRGYGGQKKFAAELAKHEWIFFLDGDEECSAGLAEQWQGFTEAQLAGLDLLMVPRKNYVLGRYVRGWWPDRLTRIFHRGRVAWDDEVLHDTRKASSPSRVRDLAGWIEHKRHSGAGYSDYFSGKRMDERLLMVARQMHGRGKRARVWDLVFRPWLAFLKFYVLKRGFLDGTFGLLIAQKAAVSTQLKYAALWAVQNGLDSGDS
jgi:(heptosyl)LPS beta-1,4-glucosyltransferase